MGNHVEGSDEDALDRTSFHLTSSPIPPLPSDLIIGFETPSPSLAPHFLDSSLFLPAVMGWI